MASPNSSNTTVFASVAICFTSGIYQLVWGLPPWQDQIPCNRSLMQTPQQSKCRKMFHLDLIAQLSLEYCWSFAGDSNWRSDWGLCQMLQADHHYHSLARLLTQVSRTFNCRSDNITTKSTCNLGCPGATHIYGHLYVGTWCSFWTNCG